MTKRNSVRFLLHDMKLVKKRILPLFLISGIIIVTACAGEKASLETEGNQIKQTVPYGDSEDAPDLAVGIGCVLKAQDGRYHCFYTGHNDTFPEKGLDRECVMHAVSEDNTNWTKIPEDTFYASGRALRICRRPPSG